MQAPNLANQGAKDSASRAELEEGEVGVLWPQWTQEVPRGGAGEWGVRDTGWAPGGPPGEAGAREGAGFHWG